MEYTETLCWRCRNAVPSEEKGTGCSWSREFEPVEGWTAKKTTILSSGLLRSYCVKRCPLFVSDTDPKPERTVAIQKIEKPKRKPCVRRKFYLIQKDLSFDSSCEAAEWLIANGYASVCARSVSIVLSRAASNTDRFRSYGFDWECTVQAEDHRRRSCSMTIDGALYFNTIIAGCQYIVDRLKMKRTAFALCAQFNREHHDGGEFEEYGMKILIEKEKKHEQ